MADPPTEYSTTSTMLSRLVCQGRNVCPSSTAYLPGPAKKCNFRINVVHLYFFRIKIGINMCNIFCFMTHSGYLTFWAEEEDDLIN